MKILIIGATGFIGRAIYEQLKSSDNEVVASTRDFIDFSTLEPSQALTEKLQGFDIVVNVWALLLKPKPKLLSRCIPLHPWLFLMRLSPRLYIE